MLRIIRREVRTVSDHTTIVYRGRLQGRALIAQAESGINKALHADPGAANRVAAHKPQSGTLRNVWIPLAVVRDALPLFVKPQDGMPVSLLRQGIVTYTNCIIVVIASFALATLPT